MGDFRANVARAREVPVCDVLWLTMKATQLDAALKALVNPQAARVIVPLLNGIDHLAVLRARYGEDRIIAATIAGEMERVAAGHFVHRTPFLRLNVSSKGREMLGGTLEDLQKIGIECRFVDNEQTLMWSKMVFLAPLALATTAADRTTGGVWSDAAWREQLVLCVREACAVAVAEGAEVDAEAVIAGMMKMPGDMRSSMQKDVSARNPPELDAIGGPILRGAKRHGIEVPATEKLVAGVERRMKA